MLFCLGFQIEAPWPEEMPKGQIIPENQRYLKIAELPDFSDLSLKQLNVFAPKRHLGGVGVFDSSSFFSSDQPQEIDWKVHSEEFLTFQNRLLEELRTLPLRVETLNYPSLLICCSPSNPVEWQEAFIPLPFKTKTLHLYEQKGPCDFHSHWSFSFISPFEEKEHTADMAFNVYGENLQEIYRHAFIALAFKMPELLPFFIPLPHIHHLDDIIIALNQSVSAADAAMGCPLKAVSFHGDLVHLDPLTLQWEMIVDV